MVVACVVIVATAVVVVAVVAVEVIVGYSKYPDMHVDYLILTS